MHRCEGKDKTIKELTEALKRERADFENFRKRIEEEKKDWVKQGSLDLILEILPVLDNFERALQSTTPNTLTSNSKTPDQWLEGVKFIQKQLLDVLKNNGVEPIDPKPGEKFNPQFHEAVEGKGETIQTVRLKGYRVEEKVLRPTQVVVQK